MKILLDMDGVLVDFNGGFCELHGRDGFVPDRWDAYSAWGMTDHDLWAPTLDPDWWATLDWTDEGLPLLKFCVDAAGEDNVYFLTSGRSAAAAAGKTAWIERELGREWLDNLLIGHCKHLCAGPGRLLVDDGDHNVDAFIEAGGLAALVPRPWNRARGTEPLPIVQHNISCYVRNATR